MVSIAMIAFATNPEYANYDTEKVRLRLVIISIITLFSFILTRIYSIRSEEYQVNRLKRILITLTVSNYFLIIFMLDPPESIQSIAASLSSIPFIGPLLEPLSQPGVPSTQWGGLFVNSS